MGLRDELQMCLVNVVDLGAVQGWRWGGGSGEERALIWPTTHEERTFEGHYWAEGDPKPRLVVQSTFEKVVTLLEGAISVFGPAPTALERLIGEDWLDA